MTLEEFNKFCKSLKSTTNVIQWDDNSVWKIGGKIFAIHSCDTVGEPHRLSFKCSDHNFQILCELDGIEPAPYLARAKWVQITDADTMSDDDLKDYLKSAYDIIAARLTKKLRAELGLDP
ncbi:MAG: MmcQ/YjbR family DNA-binding protein [Emcibacteraceae bacterium]